MPRRSNESAVQELSDLPTGWRQETYLDFIVIVNLQGGAMTMDFKKRYFAPGWGDPSHAYLARGGIDTYKGAGWRSAMMADAIEALSLS